MGPLSKMEFFTENKGTNLHHLDSIKPTSIVESFQENAFLAAAARVPSRRAGQVMFDWHLRTSDMSLSRSLVLRHFSPCGKLDTNCISKRYNCSSLLFLMLISNYLVEQQSKSRSILFTSKTNFLSHRKSRNFVTVNNVYHLFQDCCK